MRGGLSNNGHQTKGAVERPPFESHPAQGCEIARVAEASAVLAATQLAMSGDGGALILLPQSEDFFKCAGKETFPWFGIPGLEDDDFDHRGRAALPSNGRFTRSTGSASPAPTFAAAGGTMPLARRETRPRSLTMFEAGLGASGCITSVRLLKPLSTGPEDLQNVVEISRFDYTKPKVKGRSVPMTVIGVR